MKVLNLLLSCLAVSSLAVAADLKLDKIQLPGGFKIEVFASGLDGARSMAWGQKGTLFVGTRDKGKVYAIDAKGNQYVIASGLNMPNGVAFQNGALYVAEVNRIIKFDAIESQLSKPPAFQIIANFPSDAHHGWKFIAFGPDGKLYVPVGAPCNICDVQDPYGTITTITADGKNRATFARGIRNTVGFDWHPNSKDLWFTENGRDLLGDNLPPDELNHAPKEGMHFGYPFCHAGELLDSVFGANKNCSAYTAPAKKLGPHVAALGMRFYTGKMFPSKYANQIFIAEHGSWNRTDPLGYRVMLVTLDNQQKVINYEVFAEGWLQNKKAWGRPVDVINATDGSLLVSDDLAGLIYKITYTK